MHQSQLDAFAEVCERIYRNNDTPAMLLRGPDGHDYVCLRWFNLLSKTVSWSFTEYKTDAPRGHVK